MLLNIVYNYEHYGYVTRYIFILDYLKKDCISLLKKKQVTIKKHNY